MITIISTRPRATAAIVAGPVERAPAEAAEAAEQGDNQHDDKDCSETHGLLLCLEFGAALGARVRLLVALRRGIEFDRATRRNRAVDAVLVFNRLALRARQAVTEGQA